MQKFIDEINSHIEFTYLADKTAKRYRYSIFRFINHINITKESITLEHAREYLRYLKETKELSAGTVNDHRSAIKYLFEVILDKGWNNRKVPYLKTYRKLPVILSKNEVLKFISNSENILYKAIFSTLYGSGLRIEEAINLRLSDIDSERMQIYIRESKNGSARYTILASATHKLLKEYFKKYWLEKFKKWDKEDFLFCTINKTKPITGRTIREKLKKTMKLSGITKELTPHSLRHAFATHSLEDGIDLFTIKELLGHRRIDSTSFYLELTDYKKKNVKSPLDVNL